MGRIITIIAMTGLLIATVLLVQIYGNKNRSPAAQGNSSNNDGQIVLLRDIDSISGNPTSQSPYEHCQQEPIPELCISALNLQEQIKMAIATEEVSLYALAALVLTATGLVMLGLTLYYTRSAADSTRKTLGIANTTMNITRTNAKAELRAYVSIGEIAFSKEVIGLESLQDYSTPASSIRIKFKLKNAGVTPATNVFCGLSARFSKGISGDIPEDLFFRFEPYLELIGTLASNQDLTFSRHIPLSATELEQFQKFGGTLVCRFLIRYNDVFSREIQTHVTGYVHPYEVVQDDTKLDTPMVIAMQLVGGTPYNSEIIFD